MRRGNVKVRIVEKSKRNDDDDKYEEEEREEDEDDETRVNKNPRGTDDESQKDLFWFQTRRRDRYSSGTVAARVFLVERPESRTGLS